MKLRLSFVPTPWAWQVVAAVFGAVALTLFLASAASWLHYRELGEEQQGLEQRLTRVQAQLGSLPVVTLPLEADRRQLREKVAALNAQGAPKGWPTAQLLLWLEEHTPDDVRLVSIHHKARDGEAVLVAESGNTNSLTRFLQQLEGEPGFSEVLLSKQGARAGDDNSVRFEIRLRLQS